MAGDIYYDNKDYAEALKLYEKAYKQTGLWSSVSQYAPFRLAYSIIKCRNTNDPAIINSAISWYRVALENNMSVKETAHNLLILYDDNDELIAELGKNYLYYLTDEKDLTKVFYAQANEGMYLSAAQTADKIYSLFPDVQLPGELLANSYAARGESESILSDLCKACCIFFELGDKAFEEKNYIEADRLYSTVYDKTGLWSSNSKEAPYRMAYAKMNSNYSSEDKPYIKKWFNVCCTMKINSEKAQQYLKNLDD